MAAAAIERAKSKRAADLRVAANGDTWGSVVDHDDDAASCIHRHFWGRDALVVFGARNTTGASCLHQWSVQIETRFVITSVTSLARLRWLNLSGVLLVAFLQRTPALRVVAGWGERAVHSPAGQFLRSAFTLAAVGALHARAGATTFVQTPASPVTGVVGTPLSVGFTYIGTPSEPQYFVVTGALPPGMRFDPAPTNGVVVARTPVITGTPTQGGNYTVNVQGFGLAGNGTPQPIHFTITGGAAIAPAFTRQPVSQSVSVGASVTFTAAASGSPAPTFQWRKNNAAIDGATSSTLALSRVQASDAGEYTVVISNAAGTLTSSVATLSVSTVDRAARLTNLSVRTTMGVDQRLIVGVVVHDGSRDILVRAAGPALAGFGLTTAMVDPRLELYHGTEMVLANNDWSPVIEPIFPRVGAFGFVAGSKDAAFVREFDAAYSIQAVGTGAGVVLVEAYDTGGSPAARLVNVSARNRVGTGDDILIAGFNISGTGAKQLLIRAVGPTLNAFGVSSFLSDPKLEIYNGAQTKVTENDDWNPALASTFTSAGAFQLVEGSRDAALVALLPPGSYTAQVSGANGGTGEALIEIYELR